MKSYKGDLENCFEVASQDDVWTRKEREILKRLSGMDFEEIVTQPHGSGKIYWLRGQSKYKFLVHLSTTGYNIGRV